MNKKKIYKWLYKTEGDVVTKARLAAEELFKMKQSEREDKT